MHSIITVLSLSIMSTCLAVDGDDRTAAQQLCDANTKTQLGKEKMGEIAQINYKSASCCKAESETTRTIWKQNECSKMGEYWYKHSCQSPTLLNITRHKEYICGASDAESGKCVENYYGRDCGKETMTPFSGFIEHTTGDCFEESTFSYSYDCTNYKIKEKKTTPSAGPKKKLKTGQGESRHVLSWSAVAVSIAFCLVHVHVSMF